MTSTLQLRPGHVIASRHLVTIRDERISLPDPRGLVHLQFRRYAGCPMCNLHIRSIAARHDELAAAGITEIAVFHSSRKEMLRHETLPFPVVADPGRALYREFGVERSLRSVLDPRSWSATARGIARFGVRIPAMGESPFGLPADFLIAPSGEILARKYGEHAYDHWPVDEILASAQAAYSRMG